MQEADIKLKRRQAAALIVDVVLGKQNVLGAIKAFPKDTQDDSLLTCFHILVHYEADEDIRKKDPLYKEVQDDFLVDCAKTLLKGEALPANIIDEYKDFYGSDLFYPKMNKENIIKRLKKNINL